MSIKTFQVVNMVTDNDESIVENAIGQIVGVHRVQIQGSMAGMTKHVEVEWSEPATWEEIERRVSELGYTIHRQIPDEGQ
jgi:copper chaperone CopZ